VFDHRLCMQKQEVPFCLGQIRQRLLSVQRRLLQTYDHEGQEVFGCGACR
jgi:hypothetical protein